MALALLASVPALALPRDAPLRPGPTAPLLLNDERERQLLLPLLEIPLFNILLTFNNQVMFGDPWTRVDLASISRNLEGGWVFDTDDFDINNIGHPYQGTFSFLATRSAGYTFWHGLAGTFLGSAMWEVAGEAEPPSINDMLTTTFGGAFLGEALHRTSIALLRNRGYTPSWARVAGSVVLNPMGALNRWLTGGRYDLVDYDDGTPVLARFSTGLNAVGQVSTRDEQGELQLTLGQEFHVGASLRSGLPGHRGFEPARPFDHFDVRLEVSIARQVSARLFVQGLVWGDGFAWGDWGHGAWGLFGGYDFADPPVLRVSTVSTGPGLAFAADVSPRVQLQFLGVVSAVPWGAAGAFPAGVASQRGYHIGPGGQLHLEAAFVNREAGALRAELRQYLVSGAYAEPGLEVITYAEFGAAVALSAQVQLTFDAAVSSRRAVYEGDLPDLSQDASQVRVGLTWLTDAGHGATPRPRATP